MKDHKADRDEMIAYLRHELLGPWEPWHSEGLAVLSQGSELDVTGEVRFASRKDSYGPFVQMGGSGEILQRDRPCKRYGVGVLYPRGVTLEGDVPSGIGDDEPDPSAVDETAEAFNVLTSDGEDSLRRIGERRGRTEAGDDDFDLTGANEYRPSTMAVSFVAEPKPGSSLKVNVRGGRYKRKVVTVESSDRTWWLRSEVSGSVTFESSMLLGGKNRLVRPSPEGIRLSNIEGLDLEVTAFTRPRSDGTTLLTISLINRAVPGSNTGPDEVSLFQTRFQVELVDEGERKSAIRPYGPSAERELSDSSLIDLETESFDLLYRRMKIFGIGHGCSADWDGPAEDAVFDVRADPLPMVETPSITPTIRSKNIDGIVEDVAVPMGPLAGLDGENDGFASMERVVDLYEQWVEEKRREVGSLRQEYRGAANRHLQDCQRAVARLRSGLEFVSTGMARRAFKLANEAILLQQLRTRPTARATEIQGLRFTVPERLEVPDWKDARGRGTWRPFQIAFLLAAMESAVDADHSDRGTVELIWFPTGGGKTEAYLGLAAFALFYRRLKDPGDHGVEVLMRYTLRLLTQQQFQRASSLICAMEHIRGREADLGTAEFSIGIWLGGDSTPNSRAEARYVLRELNKDDDRAENKFVILRCPWCSASMGPIDKKDVHGKQGKNFSKVAGYLEDGGTVVFRCPDTSCEFTSGLPVYVIDEDIYEAKPSIVIATVDKFAMLAWRTDCRSLFGIGQDGTRVLSPPQTIIQDELHLISGPLGSMVGLFEPIIEQLCTDERGSRPRKPKIVSSTATIRRYEEQIKALYDRDDVFLFPPRGLDASDSFFASYATDADGTPSAGRLYVGIHAPGLGSVQTAEVRTMSALLQGSFDFDDEGRDPWWTLMVFFNSLRELGTSLTLLQSDIPDYLKVIQNRFGRSPKDTRRLRSVLELTGRLSSDQVPKSMDRLSRPASADAVDVCLASNVIEVGIDIDRLSLMAVVGQPKTTSQYIQVTGRIGRQWWARPGLVATIFSATKPRDRSHFEKFRSYHERLYAQVEPTSVTPFAPPVLDRALHAVLVAFVRQNGQSTLPPWPVPYDLIAKAYEILARRVESIDKDEEESFKRVFDQRRAEWVDWERRIWQNWGNDEEIPLLRRAGEYVSNAARDLSWSTPTSLRNVDAECRAEVSLRYLQERNNV